MRSIGDLAFLSDCQIDLRDGDLLGNFPQGLSHIGLVTAAWGITQAAGQPDAPPGKR